MTVKWLAPAGLLAALIAAGVFFGTRSLDQADKYASVASFLLALCVAIGSAVVWARGHSREADRRDAPGAIIDQSRHASNSGTVFMGDHVTYGAPARPPGQREKHPDGGVRRDGRGPVAPGDRPERPAPPERK